MKKLFKTLYLFICVALLLSATALAYLDPATLTYVIQIVAGAAIACGAAVGIFWKRIKLFFKKKAKKRRKARAKKAANDASDGGAQI